MRTKNIAIIGAGFAGLASATLLARDGHRVTVFEKFAKPEAIGAGILIQPTGLAAMRVLGIEDEILRHGQKVDWLNGVTPTGRQLIDIRYDDWQRGAFGVGLHRGVLFNALWASATNAGVTIVTDHEVRELDDIQTKFALTVIADGAHSALRAQTGLKHRATAYPWGAVWAVLPDPARAYGKTLWQWYDRAEKMFGIMPTGLRPNDPTPVVSLFWSLHSDRLDAWKARGLAAWKHDALTLNPGCEALLSQLTDASQLTWARYVDVVMPQYHTDRAVVIGDAAHATSPQLGQGTNLALMDAVALAKCVRTNVDVLVALAAYTRARKTHLHFYGQASRLLTPVFQSDGRVLPWLRDLMLVRSSKWPMARDINRQTLVGVRRGWFRGEMGLEEIKS